MPYLSLIVFKLLAFEILAISIFQDLGLVFSIYINQNFHLIYKYFLQLAKEQNYLLNTRRFWTIAIPSPKINNFEI